MVVGSFSTTVDVAIVGGGPAGLAAALEARSRGRSVAVVLHGGGSRLARPGADPLLAAARAMEIDLLDGEAVLDGDRQLRIPGNVDVPRLRFRRLVLAPDLAPPAADGSPAPVSPWSRVLAATTPPDAGAVALVRGDDEAAAAAAARLAQVGWTVRLEPGDGGLLPAADGVVRAAITAMLRTLGVQMLTPAAANAAAGEAGAPNLIVDGRDLPANIAGLGLDATAVRLSGGRIDVDEQLRTADPRMFAAGAAVAGPAAEGRWVRQGVVAGAAAAGAPDAFDEPLPLHLVPLADLGFAAWCGRTEAAASPDEPPLRVAAASAGPHPGGPQSHDDEPPLDAADPAAHCRLLIDAGGLIVGASLVAGAAADSAAELLLAVEMAAEPADLAGIARDPGSIAAVAIDRAARAAVAMLEAGDAASPAPSSPAPGPALTR